MKRTVSSVLCHPSFPAPATVPVAVTDGSSATNLNRNGVRLWTAALASTCPLLVNSPPVAVAGGDAIDM